jgi:hypothetical protein
LSGMNLPELFRTRWISQICRNIRLTNFGLLSDAGAAVPRFSFLQKDFSRTLLALAVGWAHGPVSGP